VFLDVIAKIRLRRARNNVQEVEEPLFSRGRGEYED